MTTAHARQLRLVFMRDCSNPDCDRKFVTHSDEDHDLCEECEAQLDAERYAREGALTNGERKGHLDDDLGIPF